MNNNKKPTSRPPHQANIYQLLKSHYVFGPTISYILVSPPAHLNH